MGLQDMAMIYHSPFPFKIVTAYDFFWREDVCKSNCSLIGNSDTHNFICLGTILPLASWNHDSRVAKHANEWMLILITILVFYNLFSGGCKFSRTGNLW